MGSQYLSSIKFKGAKSDGKRGAPEVLPLHAMETVPEEPVHAVPPPSPRTRSRSDAQLSLAYNCGSRHLLFSMSPDTDSLDSMGVGESLPKFYRRSDRRLRRLNTSLLEAIKCKDKLEVERLLNQGANPNATCYLDYVSTCHLAAVADSDILSLLISRGAEKMQADRRGRTPLHLAAWMGNIAQIAILLNIPKAIQNKMKQDMTIEIMEEIWNTNSNYKDLANVRCNLGELTRTLPKDWQDNIDHNCRGHEDSLPLLQPGWTPLHVASANAKHQAVHLLLAAGSDPNIRDFVGRTALDVAGFAFYSGRHINPNDFAEVIKLLLRADPKGNNFDQNKILNTPLHTAVELESVDAISDLIIAGASVHSLNRNGQTPMHVCVEKRLKEHLQVLIYNGNSDAEYDISVVNERDKDGRTVFHSAVLANWMPGVCVALEAGANISTMAHDGETPIHSAAAMGNLDMINEILNVAKTKTFDIDCKNARNETALFKAVINGHVDCVRKLLKEGASIEVALPRREYLFHTAAKKGLSDVLKVLLDHDYSVTRAMINFLTVDDGIGFGPIHFAVLNNHVECVKLLLSKNAYVSLRASLGFYKHSTPLHLAAMKNHLEIAKILVKFDGRTVHNVNSLNWTPLHTASHHKSRDVIRFLIDEGADLSACTDGPTKYRKTAIEMIMNNLSQPTEFIEEVFDSYITTNDLNLQDPKCEVDVHYDVILPKGSDKGQIAVIEEIIKTGNRQNQARLLVHPLIESFLYLKWRALLPFFYIIVSVYGAFVFSLTIFILSTFFYNDTDSHTPRILDPVAWAVVVYVTAGIWVLQELIFLTPTRRYFKELENWLKFFSVSLAVIIPYNSIHLTPDLNWLRHVATMALLLSWVELMFLLSRFPKWGYYVPMFRKVSLKVIKILFTFAFLIIGFSLSFMIQFHSKGPFENPFAALVKTMVMMTSEFDYDDLIDKDKIKNASPSLLTIRLVFLGFLIFTAIVLMNLMVGVAVNDLQNLEVMGNIRRLEKQVEFLVSLEALVQSKFFHKVLPSRVLKEFTVKKQITLFPSEHSCKFFKILPTYIRNSIFDIAQSQKQNTQLELDTKTFKMQLDELYTAIVRNKKANDECPKILIEKRKHDDATVAELKNQLDMYFERTQYAIELLNLKLDAIIDKSTQSK